MDFLKGLLGAGAGLLTGGVGGAVLGGLGAMGGGPHEDPQLKAMRLQQQGISNELLGYAHSVPGSAPDELANMAQSRALLGEQQRQVQNRTMGSWNPNQGTSATGLLSNLGNTQIAQQMAQRASFLQDASANRRRALMDAANLGQGAASLYRPQQPQFPQVAAQLAQMLAYQQAQKQAQQQQQQGNGDVNTLLQQGGVLGGFYNQAPGAAPAQPPTGWQAPGVLGGISPDAMAALQQMGWGMQTSPANGPAGSLTPGASYQEAPGQIQGGQGAQAPGNEPYGVNSTANQTRQANGFSMPMVGGVIPGLQDYPGRQFLMPGGLRLRF